MLDVQLRRKEHEKQQQVANKKWAKQIAKY